MGCFALRSGADSEDVMFATIALCQIDEGGVISGALFTKLTVTLEQDKIDAELPLHSSFIVGNSGSLFPLNLYSLLK